MKHPVWLLCWLTCSAHFAAAQCVPARDAAKLVASDGVLGDLFSTAVALSGDTALVGAVNEFPVGAAYVYERDFGGNDSWGEVKKLGSNSLEGDDGFGGAVALEGDTAVVGARKHNSPFNETGAAFVFLRDAGGPANWGEIRKLSPSEPAPAQLFGVAVALSGDTLAVGSLGGPFPIAGAVYIFERDAGGPDNWGEVKQITAFDAEADDQFALVALSGDTLLVGAPGDDDNGSASGSVYFFERDLGGPGNWGLVTKRSASDGAAVDVYGWTIDLDDDTAVVGAPYADLGTLERAGAAYVLERNAGGANSWGELQKLTAADSVAHDNFGFGVALDGGLIIAGSPYDDSHGTESGAAYLFQRDAGGPGVWGEVGEFFVSEDPFYERFGYDVALDDDRSVVGGPADNGNAGAAWIFDHWLWRNFCSANANSTGGAAHLSASGSTSVAANDLVLSASPVPNTPGVYFYGRSRIQVPFGDGLRCVGGATYRLPVSVGSGNVNRLALDVTSPPQASGQIAAGDTFRFQCWYRDPQGAGSGSNTSDGVSVVFCP